MSINQNVSTCVAAGTNNGCRPVSAYMNNSQYRGAGDSNYHGLHVLPAASEGLVLCPGQLRVVEVHERPWRSVLQLAD